MIKFWKKGIKQKAIVIGIFLILLLAGAIIGSQQGTLISIMDFHQVKI